MPEKGAIIGISVGVALLAAIILVVISFQNLQYYEFGFRRTKSTGRVMVDSVYTSGRYFFGPDVEFKIFKSSAHTLEFEGISVFAADKLEMQISVFLTYFLRKDDLPLLHKKFDLSYKDKLRTVAQDSIKNAATSFVTREFISGRTTVEAALAKAVREKLGGTCCRKDCGDSCEAGCTPYSSCTEADKGYFVDVKYFQLLEVDIPGDVEERYLEALILNEETEKEKFIQQAKIVEIETDKEVDEFNNIAQEIAHNATAVSNLVEAKAEAAATAVVEQARSNGLRDLYTRLGITDTNQRASFDYLRTIKDMERAHLTINFNQFISGPVTTK